MSRVGGDWAFLINVVIWGLWFQRLGACFQPMYVCMYVCMHVRMHVCIDTHVLLPLCPSTYLPRLDYQSTKIAMRSQVPTCS